jgi:hypothetical protein
MTPLLRSLSRARAFRAAAYLSLLSFRTLKKTQTTSKRSIMISADDVSVSSLDDALVRLAAVLVLCAGAEAQGHDQVPIADVRAAVGEVISSLGDPTRHVIEFRADGWTIQHPLSDRMGGRLLFDCPVNRAALEDLAGPPLEGLGRYYCHLSETGRVQVGTRLEAEDDD